MIRPETFHNDLVRYDPGIRLYNKLSGLGFYTLNFIFFLESRCWSVLKPTGNGPCPRRNFSCCVIGDRVFLFGGIGYMHIQFYL